MVQIHSLYLLIDSKIEIIAPAVFQNHSLSLLNSHFVTVAFHFWKVTVYFCINSVSIKKQFLSPSRTNYINFFFFSFATFFSLSSFSFPFFSLCSLFSLGFLVVDSVAWACAAKIGLGWWVCTGFGSLPRLTNSRTCSWSHGWRPHVEAEARSGFFFFLIL